MTFISFVGVHKHGLLPSVLIRAAHSQDVFWGSTSDRTSGNGAQDIQGKGAQRSLLINVLNARAVANRSWLSKGSEAQDDGPWVSLNDRNRF